MKLHQAISAAIGVSLLSTAAVATDLPSRISPPPPPILADIFGAIALSSDNATDGSDWGAATPDEAAGRARAFCEQAGGRDCTVVVTVESRSSFWRARHTDDQSD